MSSKRIFKLKFLVGLNINQESSILKVKKEDENIWYQFDDEHQNPDFHKIIQKKVSGFKLNKKSITKEF
jgi:hypothetical protein